MKTVIPSMRERRSGTIVNVGRTAEAKVCLGDLVSIINHATINGINSDEAAEMSNHPWS
ncbi:hypothetical protein PABG_06581 [Paracoccidioides brasiliensis Pb03]|nr:hypothetical protein PABG_06581 [Paracoccidioides brasiliensis Pb03]